MDGVAKFRSRKRMNAPIDDIIADDLYKCQHQSDEPAVRSKAEIFDDDTMSRLPKK